MDRRYLALLAIILAALAGGGNPVFSKISLREIPPLTFIFIRFFLALLFIFPLFLREKPKFSKNILKVVLVSLFSTANIILFVFGIRLTTATVAQMIYVFVPIMTAVISYFLIKEHFTFKKLGGILLGFSGMMLIVLLPIIGQPSPLKGNLLGNLLILAGATLFSFYPVFSKKLQTRYSPTYLTVVFLAVTALIHALLFPIELATQPQSIQAVSLNAWLALIYVAAFGTTVLYLLTQYAIKHGSATIGATILYLQPIATFGWAAILLEEKLTPSLAIGGLMVLTGAYLVTQAHNRSPKR